MQNVNEGWVIEDHVCRVCLGRVLSKQTEDDQTEYRCSNCGITAVGHNPSVICACGMRLKTGKKAGFKCQRASDPRPEFPAEVVVSDGTT